MTDCDQSEVCKLFSEQQQKLEGNSASHFKIDCKSGSA